MKAFLMASGFAAVAVLIAACERQPDVAAPPPTRETATRTLGGGVPFKTWSDVVAANSDLRTKSPLAAKYLRLSNLDDTTAGDPAQLADIVALAPSLRSSFLHWWETMQREGSRPFDPADSSPFAAMDAAGAALTDAIRRHATLEDVPFLLFLDDLREYRMWVAGEAWQASRDLLLKELQLDPEAVLGLVLTAFEQANFPDARTRLLEVLAQAPDPRSLPTLVAWLRDHPMYSRRGVVEAIHQIDPREDTLTLYYAYTEQYAQVGFVPGETQKARELRRELAELRTEASK